MTKTYVLDTNVLIQSPSCLLSFAENTLVLPIVCLEELDRLKNEDGERGANARECIRFFESLRQKGDLLTGVQLESGGIEAQDFMSEQSPRLSEQYNGRIEVYANDEKFTSFKKKGLDPEDVYMMSADKSYEITPVINQFFVIHSEINPKKTLLGRFNGKTIVPLEYQKKNPLGVRPKNVGQFFLQEALMMKAEDCPLVIVKGAAGTAKTFYSLAVGLEKMMSPNDCEYRKILITRPNIQFDEEIGYLPGSEQEKIAPFLRPVIDNLEVLLDHSEKDRYKSEKELRDKINELFDRGYINSEAMNFIRGRTINYTYLIIDEAQNLTPKQAKGIITRVGKGTKVILLGDPQQIDHPFLDERTNGLSYASEKMRGSHLCYQLTMQNNECERSTLAFDAASRMY